MPAFGDNNIGVALRRLDEHLVHGLDRGQILRDDRLQIAAAGESDTDIIMLTHRTVERNANAAIAKIEVLESVQGKVTKLRVESLS